jgi:hypothetical protein
MHGLVTSHGMDLWCPIFIFVELRWNFLPFSMSYLSYIWTLHYSLHCYAHVCTSTTLGGHVNFPFMTRTLLRSLHILTWSIAAHKLTTLMQVACTTPTINATLYHSLARGTAVSNFHTILIGYYAYIYVFSLCLHNFGPYRTIQFYTS